MPAQIALSCSRCGQIAVRLRLPRIPDTLRGFVGGVLMIANGKLKDAGVQLSVPASGEIADAIPTDQLPAIASALETECLDCISGRAPSMLED